MRFTLICDIDLSEDKPGLINNLRVKPAEMFPAVKKLLFNPHPVQSTANYLKKASPREIGFFTIWGIASTMDMVVDGLQKEMEKDNG